MGTTLKFLSENTVRKCTFGKGDAFVKAGPRLRREDCENCENYSYDLRFTGAASGRGSLLCAECRDIFSHE